MDKQLPEELVIENGKEEHCEEEDEEEEEETEEEPQRKSVWPSDKFLDLNTLCIGLVGSKYLVVTPFTLLLISLTSSL